MAVSNFASVPRKGFYKIVSSYAEALEGFTSGMTVMVGTGKIITDLEISSARPHDSQHISDVKRRIYGPTAPTAVWITDRPCKRLKLKTLFWKKPLKTIL